MTQVEAIEIVEEQLAAARRAYETTNEAIDAMIRPRPSP